MFPQKKLLNYIQNVEKISNNSKRLFFFDAFSSTVPSPSGYCLILFAHVEKAINLQNKHIKMLNKSKHVHILYEPLLKKYEQHVSSFFVSLCEGFSHFGQQRKGIDHSAVVLKRTTQIGRRNGLNV